MYNLNSLFAYSIRIYIFKYKNEFLYFHSLETLHN
jgi:hypothetical protein